MDSPAGKLGVGCGQMGGLNELDVYLLRNHVGAYAPACYYDNDSFALSSKQRTIRILQHSKVSRVQIFYIALWSVLHANHDSPLSDRHVGSGACSFSESTSLVSNALSKYSISDRPNDSSAQTHMSSLELLLHPVSSPPLAHLVLQPSTHITHERVARKFPHEIAERFLLPATRNLPILIAAIDTGLVGL